MRPITHRARYFLVAIVAALSLWVGAAQAFEMPAGCCVERIASGEPFAPRSLALPPKPPSLNLNLALTITVVVEIRRAERPAVVPTRPTGTATPLARDRPPSP